MPPVINDPNVKGAGKVDPNLLDRIVEFLIENKVIPKPEAKHDEFVRHGDHEKEGENPEASADAGSIKGLLGAAQGLLKRIGEIMGQNITSNPTANYSKNDTAVGLGNQAKGYIERALIFEAIKKIPGLSGLATTLNSIPGSIVGFAKGAVGFWLEALKSDQAANKAVQKNADR